MLKLTKKHKKFHTKLNRHKKTGQTDVHVKCYVHHYSGSTKNGIEFYDIEHMTEVCLMENIIKFLIALPKVLQKIINLQHTIQM